MELYVYSAGVTMLTALLLFGLAFMTGMAREKGKVAILETYTTTNKDFLIANRIHLNTLENALVFLPLLWVATLFSGLPQYAATAGAIWLLARVAYAYVYRRNPAKRAPAFMLSLLSLLVLTGLCGYGLFLNW